MIVSGNVSQAITVGEGEPSELTFGDPCFGVDAFLLSYRFDGTLDKAQPRAGPGFDFPEGLAVGPRGIARRRLDRGGGFVSCDPALHVPKSDMTVTLSALVRLRVTAGAAYRFGRPAPPVGALPCESLHDCFDRPIARRRACARTSLNRAPLARERTGCAFSANEERRHHRLGANRAARPSTRRHLMRYHAFMSYSQAVDRSLAMALQSAVERFAKPWYKRRRCYVFRDSTNLSLNPGLTSSIDEALARSEYLLLLASPQAAASHWVPLEIEHWLAARSSDRILIAVTQGEVHWDRASGDFDWTRTTALPQVLRGRFAEEPLFLDLRWAAGQTSFERRDPRFSAAVADIACRLLGLPKEDLIGEDVRQHKRLLRARRLAVAGLALLTVTATTAGIIAVHERAVAERRLESALGLAGDIAILVEQELGPIPQARDARRFLTESIQTRLDELRVESDDSRLKVQTMAAHMQAGDEALLRRDWTTSRREYELALPLALEAVEVNAQRSLYALQGVYDGLGRVLRQLNELEPARQRFEAALAAAARLADLEPTNTLYRAGLGSAHENLAMVLSELGHERDAQLHRASGMAIAEEVATATKSPRAALDLVKSHAMAANQSLRSGDIEGARHDAERAAEILQERFADSRAADVIRTSLEVIKLVALTKGERYAQRCQRIDALYELQQGCGATDDDLAFVYAGALAECAGMSPGPESEGALRRSIRLYEDLLKRAPTDPQLWYGLMTPRMLLGQRLFGRNGQFVEGLDLFAAGLSAVREAVVLGDRRHCKDLMPSCDLVSQMCVLARRSADAATGLKCDAIDREIDAARALCKDVVAAP